MGKIIQHHNFRAIEEDEQSPRTFDDKRMGNTCQEIAPLVEEGQYRFVFVARFTAYIHGAPKLGLRFRIIDQGEFYGVELERWYNCQRLIGKKGKNGNFSAKRHGDFLNEYCTLFPTALTRNHRLDRISFKPFVSTIIAGRVGTVEQNARQRKIPPLLQYSTIRELVKAGA